MVSQTSQTDSGLPGRIYPAVALLSVAVLMLQIALNRVFSFTTWHHLAYISISLALLGFGASGSVLAAWPGIAARGLGRTVAFHASLAAACTVGVLVLVGVLPLELRDIARSPTALAVLVVYFAGISAPFFFAGLAIAVALREAGRRVNRLYAWDLVGAGLGCALVVVVMNALGTPRAILVAAMLFAAAGAVAAGRESRAARLANAVVAGAVLLAMGPLPDALPIPPSADKLMAPFLDNGVSYYSRWGALFRTDVIGARGGEVSEGGYSRHGRSPRYHGAVPSYRLIFHDAGAAAIMYEVGPGEDVEMFRHHVLTTPYVIQKHPEVLVIGVGGGADVVNALTNGATRVVGAELDPLTVDLITDDFREFTGGTFNRPDVEIVASEGRHFVRSRDDRFDLVQLTGVDTLAALASGAYILAENYLYTADSFGDYFDVLRPGGLLSVAALDYHPRRGTARHAMRFAALAQEALRRRGIARPGDHVAIVSESAGIAEFEVLVKLEPFTTAEVDALAHFVDDNGLEAWYLPGRPDRQLASFHTILAGSPGERDAFLASTFLDLRPTTDDRPFFFSFYKWRHLFEHRDEIDPGHMLATGQLVLVLILLVAAGFSAFAILLPLLRVRRGATALPGRAWFLGYFAALGVGFIFAEICFVQRFVLFLGYPTYALSVILSSFLVAAGGGAWLSGRLPEDPRRVLPGLVSALAATVVLYVVATPVLFDRLLPFSLAVRATVTFALCIPLGGLLGMFFPYGLRITSRRDRDFSAWAWAVNGCFTVLGSVTSVILAMAWGFTVVILSFLVIYAVGAACFLRGHARLRAATP